MAQYGDQHGHVKNHEFDSQTVHDNTGNVNMEQQGIVSHEGRRVDQPYQESSISSGEEIGGVRNKKGLTKKIMEKIPGVSPKEEQSHHTTTGDASTMPGDEGEKKGVLDKIKENITGVGLKKEQDGDTDATTTTGTFDATTMPGGKGKHIEDDKLMDKIKEKLP